MKKTGRESRTRTVSWRWSMALSLVVFGCSDSTALVGPADASNKGGGGPGSGGGDGGGGGLAPSNGGRTGPAPTVVVAINPGATTAVVGASVQFGADVRGGPA